MKRFLLFLIFLLPISSATQQVNTDNIIQINSVNITFSSIQYFDTLESGSNYITLNTSKLQLTPTSQISVKINNYNTISDAYNISFTGTGTVDIQQKVLSNNKLYNFFKGGTYSFGVTSNSSGWITKTITLTGNEDIYTYPLAYTSSSTGGGGSNTELVTPTPTTSFLSNISSPTLTIPNLSFPFELPISPNTTVGILALVLMSYVGHITYSKFKSRKKVYKFVKKYS